MTAPPPRPLPRSITVLSGGVGGARFLQGLLRLVERTGGDTSETRVTVVANTADDIWLHGLKVCPDLAREGGAGGVRRRAHLVRAR